MGWKGVLDIFRACRLASQRYLAAECAGLIPSFLSFLLFLLFPFFFLPPPWPPHGAEGAGFFFGVWISDGQPSL